jgi:hypothetical protein
MDATFVNRVNRVNSGYFVVKVDIGHLVAYIYVKDKTSDSSAHQWNKPWGKAKKNLFTSGQLHFLHNSSRHYCCLQFMLRRIYDSEPNRLLLSN